MAQGQFWLVRSPGELDHRLAAYGDYLRERNEWPVCWQMKPYEHPRTMSQNALLHVWCRDYAEHLLKHKASEEEVLAMKYTLQRHCYAATGWDFLIKWRKDLFTGKQKAERASTTDMGQGEMFQYMTWIQTAAADDGLILEAKGEYLDLKHEEVA